MGLTYLSLTILCLTLVATANAHCLFPHSCQNWGTCVGIGTPYSHCACRRENLGEHCEYLNPCFNNQRCGPNGFCVPIFSGDRPTDFRCMCHPDYTGQFCQTRLYCVSGPCQNGGTCHEAPPTALGFTCECHKGCKGYLCDKCPGKYSRSCNPVAMSDSELTQSISNQVPPGCTCQVSKRHSTVYKCHGNCGESSVISVGRLSGGSCQFMYAKRHCDCCRDTSQGSNVDVVFVCTGLCPNRMMAAFQSFTTCKCIPCSPQRPPPGC